MSTGLSLAVLDPPLDTDALLAFLAQLPGLTRRDDGAWLLHGGRVLIHIEPPRVLIAFQWTDSPEGHGRAVGDWILSRHRCTGQDVDYGTMLADNAACAAHLAKISRVTPSTPERTRAVLASWLVGAYIHSIEITWADFTVRFARDDQITAALRLSRMDAALLPLPDDEDVLTDELLLTTLYDRLEDGRRAVSGVSVGWQAPLTISWGPEQLCFGAAGTALPGDEVWTLEDSDGHALIRATAGGGPVVVG